MLNADKTLTNERIMTLDDAFELLKNRCIINVDKFWTAPERITKCIRRHAMEEQVIIKTPLNKKHITACSQIAFDLPFMPITRSKSDLQKLILSDIKLNIIGAEICFRDDNDDIVSDEFIESLHKRNLKIWGNAIVYSYKDILAGGHTDDAAVTGDMDYGWGWFVEKGFDIVQTDWVYQMKKYFEALMQKDN